MAPLGIKVRAGLHTGEVERTESDVLGIAVHLAARIMDAASADEVVISRTVKDLVADSGIAFDDAGPLHIADCGPALVARCVQARYYAVRRRQSTALP